MSKKAIQKCIDSLSSDGEVLDGVLQWIVEKEHTKKFKKCVDNSCEDCEKIGLTKTFHGRSCYQCNLFNVRQRYSKKNKPSK